MNTEKYCLLVDDDPEDREIFIDALHAISSTTGCFAVSNGEEALLMLQDALVNPDYIFTDLQMPVMDGLTFIKSLRGIERFRNTPVIVLSSNLSSVQVEKLKLFSVTAIYPKTKEEMLKKILKKYFPQPGKRLTIL